MTLYVVATPIGNLKDITFRAIEILRNVDVIACEDTRVTKKLLSHYSISKPLISYREQVHHTVSRKILSLLKKGKSIALVTDAGTPGISDPGTRLVSDALNAGFPVVSLPGPSAITAALSVSGVNADRFVFLGFPPHKKGRTAFFGKMKEFTIPMVLYESPHRLYRTLRDLEAFLGLDREVVIVKEVTKIYEKIIRGKIPEVIETLLKINNYHKTRGEFVIIINAREV
ncbi:MAG: 16S rRNA (cytidine(1402)-2'-O)-methyltransferase [Candidatus Ryanbacteria bacterium RIFCSPHIGHO2_02_FULL_45_43]|uniref:Ribosomal RNA small subunit methyltransferase I n=1 Tax=Candidatus Ryanbacteria bacterium RIFCSPHIGHO2_01_45_13 TaxID=1802112 RepID=A0A1G2FXC0_9BACT|nr:MAG: 16S rRNA (cytidine(1402)-2'-O)-methyltransferase [Candidatus Ryanbacteria bacterium RIFCSPHIGHO2_01_45_13]OGZ42371.1 MAG: 16S rRNA (cytidine(1402)-2'-O)-methyltransferase [Candidatus Ryanbacteria bacterium RIFCSPHIGHO2_01_FULL_44_130]OGZ48332.1 MAG: 16S rRNA (cytidine(1402)-2'-O)-methyltransferase [Candidatus Ryanbacteria bacterium RIFCSPHIGHO2_02_FULL_45_43]OGZ50442.1 MAG: 16S rRNA (cytidine(1402)-2'-O)-methyltransferase [Candidatus Ryanbacteria bacterium RIFCSPHIGHO2_12_FULL_44_20]OGZ